MHNQFKTQKFKHLMLAMGPRDLNSAPYSPVYCSSHSMTSFQSSELTELPVVENSQLCTARAQRSLRPLWPHEYTGMGQWRGPCNANRLFLEQAMRIPGHLGQGHGDRKPTGGGDALHLFWHLTSTMHKKRSVDRKGGPFIRDGDW